MEAAIHKLYCLLAEKAKVDLTKKRKSKALKLDMACRPFHRDELQKIVENVERDMGNFHKRYSSQSHTLNKEGTLEKFYDSGCDIEKRDFEAAKILLLLKIYDESDDKKREKMVELLSDDDYLNNDLIKEWKEFQLNEIKEIAARNNLNLTSLNDAGGSTLNEFKKIAGDYLCIRSSTNGRWIHFYKITIDEQGGVNFHKLIKERKGVYKVYTNRGNIIDIDSDSYKTRFLIKVVGKHRDHASEGSHFYYVFEKFAQENQFRGFQLGGRLNDLEIAAKRCKLFGIDKNKSDLLSTIWGLLPLDLYVNANTFKRFPLKGDKNFIPMRLGGKNDNILMYHDAGVKENSSDAQLPRPVMGDVFFYAAKYMFDEYERNDKWDIAFFQEIAKLLMLSAEHASFKDFQRTRISENAKNTDYAAMVEKDNIEAEKKDSERAEFYKKLKDRVGDVFSGELDKRFEPFLKIHYDMDLEQFLEKQFEALSEKEKEYIMAELNKPENKKRDVSKYQVMLFSMLEKII